ncbi:hypothetical protein M8J76_000566 [Diaphorina citri]|nr:hypothetical protein M8J76_000566 [Diaphorina citri]
MARVLLVLSILLLLSHVELLQDPSHKRKGTDSIKMQLVKTMINQNILPLGRRHQAFLYNHELSSFYVLLHSPVSLLSITLIPCSSSVDWAIYYKFDPGQFGPDSLGDCIMKTDHSTQDASTHNIENAAGGLYTFQVKAYNTTKIEWFINRYRDGMHPLAEDLWTKLKIQEHRRGKNVTVRWNVSILDPQLMQYCIVLNTRKNLSSLCEVSSDQFDDTPEIYQLKYLPNKRDIPDPSRFRDKIDIKCVGNRTSHTFSNLTQGQDYYINLFAHQNKTNLTLLYGSTYFKYDRKQKPVGMRDGKPQVLNLRENDGEVTLRYKVLNKFLPGPLEWYILSCGGIVTVEVRIRKQVIITKHQVASFRHLTIRDPIPGQRYVVHITALDRDELNKIKAVEVLATMRSRAMDTFPDLPQNTKVKEYTSLRECDSVFVGWYPGPTTSNMVRYCIKATEVPKRFAWNLTAFDSKPNQCGLDAALKKPSKAYSTMQCLYVTPHNASFRKELKQKVTNLKPGREYIIQVIMKKTRSRSLSYDLLRVNTVPTCVD